MKSLWKANYKKNKNIKITDGLKDDLDLDIVVVGGGIAGVLAAFQLAELGENVTLIEANQLFSGVTENTVAHIDAMHGYLYTDLLKQSENIAKKYFNSQLDAIAEYERIIKKYKIDCDFKKQDSYLYSKNNLTALKKEYEALQKIGADVEIFENTKVLGFDVAGVIKLKGMATFNPLDFLSQLPKKFDIIENARITKMDVDTKSLTTNKYHITANKIIVATGFPLPNYPGYFFMRMYKSTSYTIAFTGAKKIDGLYQSDVNNGFTFRNYQNYNIMGGLDHRTGRVNFDKKYERLEARAKEMFPKAKVEYKWTANDCITADGIPYVGLFSKKIPNVFVITGFNKWGMANSMIASKVISDMVLNRKHEYSEIFNPNRRIFNYKFYIKNGICSMLNYLKGLLIPLKTVKSLEPDTGDIVIYKFRKKAVYKDLDGNIFVINPKCAHQKCLLQFNSNAKTWDCPCHGSRYDIEGNIIVSPTTKSQLKQQIKNKD